MPSEWVEEFFRNLPASVLDPFTKLPPTQETELSAALIVAQSRQRIAWDRIEPSFLSQGADVRELRKILGSPGQMFAEYPLHSGSSAALNRWGNMRADAMVLSSGLDSVVMFESKVDSHFTYYDEPPDGQLSRQLEYLVSLSIPKRWLVLVCPSFNVPWYAPRLERAWQACAGREGVSACVVTWEAVLSDS
jgi:hypothetical protein